MDVRSESACGTSSIARSMSSSSMSRWVTARRTAGPSSARAARPARGARAIASSSSRPSAPTSTCTKFVSTSSEVDRQPGRGPALGEPARAGVVVGEPLDVVLERVEAGRGDDPGLAHRAAEAVLLDAGAVPSARASRRSRAPSGQPSPFERQSVDRVEARPRSRRRVRRARPRRSRAARRRGGRASPSSRAGRDDRRAARRAARPCRRPCCACSRARAPTCAASRSSPSVQRARSHLLRA